MSISRLSDCERRIIEILWNEKDKMSAYEVLEKIGENWKIQTVNTFLKRLHQKQLVKIEKMGKKYYYIPVEKREEYFSKEVRETLNKDSFFSMRQFLESFYKKIKITKEETEELQEWLNKAIKEE